VVAEVTISMAMDDDRRTSAGKNYDPSGAALAFIIDIQGPQSRLFRLELAASSKSR
jgi:hypothetical protein